jgi:ankyrin repeat protein
VITQLLKDRAEGRILVCCNSHNDIHTATEEHIFEPLQSSLNARVPIATETEEISTDTPRMFETTTEVTVDIQSNHQFALHTAAVNNNFEQVQRLVKAGVALDCGDPFGRTALWVAAKNGHKSIIRFLLQNGSCVNIPDCNGVTPLEIAAREGHWEAVDVIRMYHQTISPEVSEYLKNKLHEASESGDFQVFQAILKCGISIETTNNYGYTPLHVSAKCGYQEFSLTLLNFGANVNVKDNYGRTPLILSAENGHIDVVRELLNQDASVNIADEYGYTPLYAAAKEGHVEVVRVLLNRGASVNITDKNGFSPLYAADQRRHVEVVRELLNRGAKVGITDTYFNTLFSADVSKVAKGRDELIGEVVLCLHQQEYHISIKEFYSE